MSDFDGVLQAVLSEQAARRRALHALVALAVLGVVLRYMQFAADNSFWQDEAALVLNIFEKDAAALLGKLEIAQAAPPGFLLIERGALVMLGRSEEAMRLFPWVAGVAGMGLFAALSWRLLPPWAAAVAVGLFALSDRLIWHSVEAKQYSFDVLIALMLLSLALLGREARSAIGRLWIVVAAAGVLLWFSYTTVFTFGGISLALLPALRVKRRGALHWILGNAAFAVSLLALYLIAIRDQQVGLLYDYWADRFLDLSRPLYAPVWFLRRAVSLFNYPFELGGPVLLPLSILGGIALWRAGRRELLIALTAPAVLVLLAACVRQYPFGGSRLTLFLAPSIFLLSVFGIVELRALLRDHVAWLAPPVYLAVIGVITAGVYLFHPPARGNIAPVARYVQSHRQPGDLVYSNKTSELRCYWPDAPVRFAQHLTADKPTGRFWLVLSYTPTHGDDSLDPYKPYIDANAVRLDQMQVPGGSATLFQAATR